MTSISTQPVSKARLWTGWVLGTLPGRASPRRAVEVSRVLGQEKVPVVR